MITIEGLRVKWQPKETSLTNESSIYGRARAALAAAWTWVPTRPTTAAARYVPTVTGSVPFAPSL
jgi:hypothetical protein